MKDLLVFSPIDLKLFSSENQEVELLLVVHMLSEYLPTLIIHTHTHTHTVPQMKAKVPPPWAILKSMD